MKRIITCLAVLALLLSPAIGAHAQGEYTPQTLTFTIYSDGTVKTVYHFETDPFEVRVTVPLFGPPYVNAVIRDEEGNPLGSTVEGANVTVDSLGALELTFTYLTSSLTTKEGIIWAFNASTPVAARVELPEGAAIFDLSDIPNEIGTVGGRQFLEMPLGDIYVFYVIGLPDLEAEALTAIADAETYIAGKEAAGYTLTEARQTLADAETLFDEFEYVASKAAAAEARTQAETLVSQADSATEKISVAAAAIAQAREDGRTVGLDEAQASLDTVQTYYDEGRYVEAEALAQQAYQQALTAEAPSSNTLLYVAGLAAVALAAGGYLFMRRKGGEAPPAEEAPAVPSAEPAEVDLDKIYWRHQDLRLEDKEVLRFLAESNGEAFASEIRDRFDIPRSSAWRLIRRLVNNEIVEERKIGNQSLVRIRDEYRR